ncbi:hypothetical protein BV25DRAFT_1804024, partial [Artomyces pyxidatus]
IIDGRYHTQCGHFVSMSTRLQDCMRPNCIFSVRHIHPTGCKSSSCLRMMAPPVRNPIRHSATRCGDCVQWDLSGPARSP